VAPLIRINDYFDLVLLVLVALGLIFELPVLIFLLCYFGIVTPKFLVQNTKYAILVITVAAAFVTPTPDALTMLLVMVVMLALYFLGVGVAWLALRNRAKQQAAAAAAQGA
jgi:sec-independent protein translocase protein TatC